MCSSDLPDAALYGDVLAVSTGASAAAAATVYAPVTASNAAAFASAVAGAHTDGNALNFDGASGAGAPGAGALAAEDGWDEGNPFDDAAPPVMLDSKLEAAMRFAAKEDARHGITSNKSASMAAGESSEQQSASSSTTPAETVVSMVPLVSLSRLPLQEQWHALSGRFSTEFTTPAPSPYHLNAFLASLPRALAPLPTTIAALSGARAASVAAARAFARSEQHRRHAAMLVSLIETAFARSLPGAALLASANPDADPTLLGAALPSAAAASLTVGIERAYGAPALQTVAAALPGGLVAGDMQLHCRELKSDLFTTDTSANADVGAASSDDARVTVTLTREDGSTETRRLTRAQTAKLATVRRACASDTRFAATTDEQRVRAVLGLPGAGVATGALAAAQSRVAEGTRALNLDACLPTGNFTPYAAGGPEPTSMTYDLVLEELLRIGADDAFVALVYRQIARNRPGAQASEANVSAAIVRCRALGDPAAALSLLSVLRRAGYEPSLHTYTQVLSALADGGAPGQWEEESALTVIRWLERAADEAGHEGPDAVAYNVALSCCTTWRAAVALLGKMKSMDVAPTAVTFTQVLAICARDNAPADVVDRVHSVLQDNIAKEQREVAEIEDAFLSSGGESHGSSHDPGLERLRASLTIGGVTDESALQARLHAVSAAGQVERALAMVNKALAEGEPVNSDLFSMLMQAVAAGGESTGVEDAKKVMSTALKANLADSVKLWMSYMQVCMAHGHDTHALGAFAFLGQAAGLPAVIPFHHNPFFDPAAWQELDPAFRATADLHGAWTRAQSGKLPTLLSAAELPLFRDNGVRHGSVFAEKSTVMRCASLASRAGVAVDENTAMMDAVWRGESHEMFLPPLYAPHADAVVTRLVLREWQGVMRMYWAAAAAALAHGPSSRDQQKPVVAASILPGSDDAGSESAAASPISAAPTVTLAGAMDKVISRLGFNTTGKSTSAESDAAAPLLHFSTSSANRNNAPFSTSELLSRLPIRLPQPDSRMLHLALELLHRVPLPAAATQLLSHMISTRATVLAAHAAACAPPPRFGGARGGARGGSRFFAPPVQSDAEIAAEAAEAAEAVAAAGGATEDTLDFVAKSLPQQSLEEGVVQYLTLQQAGLAPSAFGQNGNNGSTAGVSNTNNGSNAVVRVDVTGDRVGTAQLKMHTALALLLDSHIRANTEFAENNTSNSHAGGRGGPSLQPHIGVPRELQIRCGTAHAPDLVLQDGIIHAIAPLFGHLRQSTSGTLSIRGSDLATGLKRLLYTTQSRITESLKELSDVDNVLTADAAFLAHCSAVLSSTPDAASAAALVQSSLPAPLAPYTPAAAAVTSWPPAPRRSLTASLNTARVLLQRTQQGLESAKAFYDAVPRRVRRFVAPDAPPVVLRGVRVAHWMWPQRTPMVSTLMFASQPLARYAEARAQAAINSASAANAAAGAVAPPVVAQLPAFARAPLRPGAAAAAALPPPAPLSAAAAAAAAAENKRRIRAASAFLRPASLQSELSIIAAGDALDTSYKCAATASAAIDATAKRVQGSRLNRRDREAADRAAAAAAAAVTASAADATAAGANVTVAPNNNKAGSDNKTSRDNANAGDLKTGGASKQWFAGSGKIASIGRSSTTGGVQNNIKTTRREFSTVIAPMRVAAANSAVNGSGVQSC